MQTYWPPFDVTLTEGDLSMRVVRDEDLPELIAAALQMLVNAKLLTPDAPLEAFLRAAAGLPAPDPDTARDDAPTTGGAPDDGSTEPPAPSSTRSAAAKARQRREHPKNKQGGLW